MAELDATALVGLLADAHRRRVVAAVELGAVHVDEIVAATGLTSTQVAKALGKLVETGLVVSGDDGLARGRRCVSARRPRRPTPAPPSTEFADAPDDVRKVLRAFVVDGRLQSIPVAAGKRMVILDWLAQEFEPGTTYSEKMVNLILGKRHADTAALRRYLVDRGLPRSGRWPVLAKRRYGRAVTPLRGAGGRPRRLDLADSGSISSPGSCAPSRHQHVGLCRIAGADQRGVEGVGRSSTAPRLRPIARGRARRTRRRQRSACRRRRSVLRRSRASRGASLPASPRWASASCCWACSPTSPRRPARPTTCSQAGSCVVIEDNGDASEVNCDTDHDGVVESLIGADELCPTEFEPHRDQPRSRRRVHPFRRLTRRSTVRMDWPPLLVLRHCTGV